MLGQKLNASQIVYSKTETKRESVPASRTLARRRGAWHFCASRLDDFDASFIEDLKMAKPSLSATCARIPVLQA